MRDELLIGEGVLNEEEFQLREGFLIGEKEAPYEGGIPDQGRILDDHAFQKTEKRIPKLGEKMRRMRRREISNYPFFSK